MRLVRARIELDAAFEQFCCMSAPTFSRMNYLYFQGQVANDSTYFTCSYHGFVLTQLHYKPAVTCGKKSICVEFLHRLPYRSPQGSRYGVSSVLFSSSKITRYFETPRV